MGLGDAIAGLFGFVEDERSAAQQAQERTRYEALQKEKEMERENNEKMQEQERENRQKLEEANNKAAAEQKRANEEKMKLEREKMDMLKEASEVQLRMTMENNERQRESERERNDQIREIEKNSRDAEIRLREENEQKREKERAEARAREEKKQMEAKTAIDEANRSVMEMKDKTHTDITRLVMENQNNKDELMKENFKIMEAKDAASAEKLDKLTSTYQTQVKETQELAQQREDALHLERKAVDEKYRKDMENKDKMSKEERDKMTTDYQKMIEEKDKELSRNQREKEAKMDELNKNHLGDLRKAHEDYNKLQESSKAEVARLQKEKEEVLRESAAKLEDAGRKMLEITEKKNDQLLALSHQSAYSEAVKMKENSEILRISKCNDELAPIRDIKFALFDNVTQSCELWSKLGRKGEDPDKIKDQIINRSQAMKGNISKLIMTIDASRSLGEQKSQWKDELKKLSNDTAEYAKHVTREINEEETTKRRLQEIEDECDELRQAIENLPDMTVESIETVMNRNAQGSIAFAEARGVTKAIAAAAEEKNAKTIENEPVEEPVVEEP